MKHFGLGSMPLVSVVGLGILNSAVPALADEATQPAAEQAGAPELAEIVVTAQKRSESLMKVPVAIDAFTADRLESAGVEGVQGLEFATPAVVFTNTGAFQQPYIRGVGSRLLQNGLDPSVAVYDDNRYVARQSAMNFNFADIERVEVLKGPQGVLFGRNASAGAIRVITKDVSDRLEGYVKGSYGNYDAYSAAAAVNVPVSEQLGFRLSASTDQRNGYVHNIFPAGRYEWNDQNQDQIRGKLKLRATDDFTVGLTLGYWLRRDMDGNADNQLPPLQYAVGTATGITAVRPDQVASAVTRPISIKSFSSELDLTYKLPSFDIKSISTYANVDSQLSFDGDGTSTMLTDALIYENANTVSEEINITSTTSGPVDWLVGAYLFHDNTQFDTTFQNGSIIRSNGDQIVRTKSVAGFGQVSWHMTDALRLNAGVRYSDERKDLDLQASPHTSITIPAVPGSHSVSFNKVTPAVTLQYRLNADMMAYATYSQGFKSGGFNYPAAGAGAAPLRPEILNNYEIGFKGATPGRVLEGTISTYYYDYKELQVTRAAAAGLTPTVVTQNAANARLYGADVDLTWRPVQDLTLNASLSAEKSWYGSFPLADAKVFTGIVNGTNARGMVDVGFDATGQPLLRAPKFSGFASAVYNFKIADARLPVTVAYAYKGTYDFDFVIDPSTSALTQKGYSLVNARISYVPASARWTVSLYGNNLTNRVYFNDVVAAGSGIRGSYGAPRTFGGEVEMNF